MRKITVKTEKTVVCEINYSESSLRPEQVIEFVKKQDLVPEYDEIRTNMVTSVIQFLKYTHNFTVTV
jgi:broad-specificity NMP kinase